MAPPGVQLRRVWLYMIYQQAPGEELAKNQLFILWRYFSLLYL